jgi:predicted nucleic acid-binding protein
MPGVLIDTDVAIDFLRGAVYARPLMADLWNNANAVISVLSVYELTAGMRENEKEQTLNFIGACLIENVTTDIALTAGELYKKHRSNGVTLTPLDCLIAATALAKGYRVATRNIRHYPFEGLLLDL